MLPQLRMSMMREISLWMRLFLDRSREAIFEPLVLSHVYDTKLSGREKRQNTLQWLFGIHVLYFPVTKQAPHSNCSEHRFLDRANKISPADEMIKAIRERHDQIF